MLNTANTPQSSSAGCSRWLRTSITASAASSSNANTASAKFAAIDQLNITRANRSKNTRCPAG